MRNLCVTTLCLMIVMSAFSLAAQQKENEPQVVEKSGTLKLAEGQKSSESQKEAQKEVVKKMCRGS